MVGFCFEEFQLLTDSKTYRKYLALVLGKYCGFKPLEIRLIKVHPDHQIFRLDQAADFLESFVLKVHVVIEHSVRNTLLYLLDTRCI